MSSSRIERRMSADSPRADNFDGHLHVRIDSPTSWTLFGELDVATAWTLRSIAESAPPAGRLELWLHRLTFLDVAGWRALRWVREAYLGDMVLVSPTPAVEHLLLRIGLP